MLPIKRCRTCDHVFQSKKFGPKVTCPRCNGKNIVDANASDLKHYTKKANK